MMIFSLKIIFSISYLQSNGITTDTCYPYNSLITGSVNQCGTHCENGSDFSELYKTGYSNLTSVDQVKDFLLYEGPAIVMLEG